MIKLNGRTVRFDKFPNGESHIVSDISFDGEETLFNRMSNTVVFKYESDIDLAHLMFVGNQVQRATAHNRLIITHMPYARMDRVPNGQPFFLKYVADMINSLGFKDVWLLEPHSDVSTALLNNVRTFDMTKFLFNENKDKMKFNNNHDFLVMPDTTADRRYWNIDSDILNRIVFNKHRNYETGKIVAIDTSFNGYVKGEGRTAVILDDMSSYGGTFIQVAEKLKSFGFERIILVVAHAENAIFDGKIFTTDLIDEIYTTSSVMTRQHHPHNALKMESGKIKITPVMEIIERKLGGYNLCNNN